MTDLRFIPLKEEYYPTKYNIYLATFKLGFLTFSINMIDQTAITFPEDVKVLIKKIKPEFSKRYLNVLTIGHLGWIWYADNKFEKAEEDYKKTLATLKAGDVVIFNDISNKQQPMAISWTGIDFIW